MGAEGEVGRDGRDPYEVLSAQGSCRDALDTLYVYLDGELTAERRLRIRHHLEDCSPCLGAFDFEAELKAVIAKRCRDQVPDALRKRVARAIADASTQGSAAAGRDDRPSGSSDDGPGAEH
jgi:mycothiol system anti-sigma-R factor